MPDREHKGGRRRRPQIIAGVAFPSIAALAHYIDREPKNVRRSLAAGPIARERLVYAVQARKRKGDQP